MRGLHDSERSIHMLPYITVGGESFRVDLKMTAFKLLIKLKGIRVSGSYLNINKQLIQI